MRSEVTVMVLVSMFLLACGGSWDATKIDALPMEARMAVADGRVEVSLDAVISYPGAGELEVATSFVNDGATETSCITLRTGTVTVGPVCNVREVAQPAEEAVEESVEPDASEEDPEGDEGEEEELGAPPEADEEAAA